MIVGLIGLIGSGKGTVASQLVQKYNFRQDSFAESLKDACAMLFGWPRHLLEGDTIESREWREVVDPWWSEKLGIANFSPRYALQVIGTDILRNHFSNEMWLLTVENRVRKNMSQNVVISDVRFPNEVEFIRKQNGILIRVSRGSLPVWYDTAVMANNGNNIARNVMTKTYPLAHFSEWALAGCKTDFEINNDNTIQSLLINLENIISVISGQQKEST